MSRSPSTRSTPARPFARSVRHSQDGGRELRGIGAASKCPLDAVPPPVSAVDPLPPRQGHAPLACVAAAAALTTLDGQAVFRVLVSGTPEFRGGHLFRLRRRSRVVEIREP